jgi:hypothetical protein
MLKSVDHSGCVCATALTSEAAAVDLGVDVEFHRRNGVGAHGLPVHVDLDDVVAVSALRTDLPS